MAIPKYVWISGIVLITLYELRQWYDLYLTFKDDDDDKNDDDIPESVRHMYA